MTIASSLEVELFETGIAVSQLRNKTNSIFLEFPQTTFKSGGNKSSSKTPKSNEEYEYGSLKVISHTNFRSKNLIPIKTIYLQNLIGWTKIGFGGILIFISSSEKIIDDNDILLDIHKVKDVILIPMNYKQALNSFKKLEKKSTQSVNNLNISTNTENEEQDDESDESDEFDDEGIVESSNERIDDIESILSTPDIVCSSHSSNVTGNFTFTNFGVLTDSFKANPKLSLNDENISTSNDDDDDDDSKLNNLKHYKTFDETRSILSLRTGTGTGTGTIPSCNNLSTETNNIIKLKSNNYLMSNSLLKKLKRNLRQYLNSSGFFFSFNIDLSKKIFFKNESINSKIPNSYKSVHDNNSSFLWNHNIMKPFLKQLLNVTDTDLLITPLICGFVDFFDLKLSNFTTNEIFDSKLILLSKRSIKRSGLRYMRRGIDDDGNVANFVITDQILIIKEKDKRILFEKYRIFRGSIPLFFQQDSSKLQPIPIIQRNYKENKEKFQLHFNKLNKDFPNLICISLIEKKKKGKKYW